MVRCGRKQVALVEPTGVPVDMPVILHLAAAKHCWSEAECCNADSAQVAIFDATNSTEQRRQLLVSSHSTPS